jgi:hypothetical protein
LSTAGQPSSVNQNGFEPGTQGLGLACLDAADPVEMLVLPPAAQILDPVDPVLAGKPVGDRQPLPRIPTRFTGIKPVEALPALDRSAHGRLIIGKPAPSGLPAMRSASRQSLSGM